MPKTYKNLYPQICDFDNLLAAYQRARRGKKRRPEMYAFHFDLELNLWDLCDELLSGTYRPRSYPTMGGRIPMRGLPTESYWCAQQ